MTNEFIDKKHGKYKIIEDTKLGSGTAGKYYMIYYKEGQKPLCIGYTETIEQCMPLINLHEEEIDMRIDREYLSSTPPTAR